MTSLIPPIVVRQRKLIRTAHIDLICKQERNFDYFVTLAFNPRHEPNVKGAKLKFSAILARIDYFFIGPRWSLAPADERTLAFGMIEHASSNLHIHAVMAMPTRKRDRSIAASETLIPQRWKKLVPSGSTDIRPITDLRGVARYMTKEMNNPENWDHFMMSSEFHRS